MSTQEPGDAAGSGNAVLGDNHGNLNSGAGHQYNGPITIALDAITAIHRERRRRPVSADRLEWLEDRFVEPGNPEYATARAKLREPGTVLLSGEVGSGRRTAALMLLRGSGDGTSGFQELSVDGEDSTRWLDADLVEDNDRLLLDLSAVAPERLAAVQGVLGTFRAEVERCCYLIVVLPHDYQRFLWDEFRPLVVEIDRPSGRDVLFQHLDNDGIPLFSRDLDEPVLQPLLANGSMSELTELARLVSKARTRDTTGTAQAWLRTALDAVADHSADASAQVRGEDGRGRALLLASAMLDGASTDAVFDAERQLLHTVDFPPADVHALSDQDIAERLSGIPVDIDPQRRISFPKLGYDGALRGHFWTNFPGFRDDFRDWATSVAESVQMTDEDRQQFIERFADQALAVDRGQDLTALADRWTADATPTRVHLVLLAGLALRKGLEHELHGREFRQKFYEWAKNNTLSTLLAELVIMLSTTVIAPTYADQALVRLHYLTRHRGAGVRDAATTALLQLCAEPRFWRRVLRRLCAHPSFPEMRRQDRGLFLAIAQPEMLTDDHDRLRALITDRQVRRELTVGWRTLLTDQEGIEVSDSIRQWLTVDATHPEDSGLLTVLADACSARPALLGQVYTTCRDWVSQGEDHTARRRTAIRLRTHINRAQGLDFTNPNPTKQETTR